MTYCHNSEAHLIVWAQALSKFSTITAQLVSSSTSFTFSLILANLLIPNVLEYIYEPPISKGYVCVSDISYVCICWFDNPNSKSHKLKYVYYLKHWYVHK